MFPVCWFGPEWGRPSDPGSESTASINVINDGIRPVQWIKLDHYMKTKGVKTGVTLIIKPNTMSRVGTPRNPKTPQKQKLLADSKHQKLFF